MARAVFKPSLVVPVVNFPSLCLTGKYMYMYIRVSSVHCVYNDSTGDKLFPVMWEVCMTFQMSH